METKTCSKCGETKPLDEFHRLTRSKDGHQSRCKLCNRAYAAQWGQDNKEYVRETRREYMREYMRNRYRKAREQGAAA